MIPMNDAEETTEAVNPARAGMIPVEFAAWMMGIGKPRASGDDPQA